MKPEIKFALFCCIFCTLIAILSMSFYEGWLTGIILVCLSFPLFHITDEILRFLGFGYPPLGFWFIMNLNVFIITHSLAKVYFSFKN